MINQNIPGPIADDEDNTDGYFVVTSDGMATNETTDEAVTMLRSPWFLWKQHPYECFNFRYYFGVSLDFRPLGLARPQTFVMMLYFSPMGFVSL